MTGRKWQVNIQYSEETSALETGGGIKQALTLLGDEAFLVINGDIFLDELPQIKPLEDGALAHLWLVDNPVQHPQGDFALQEGKVNAQGHDKLTFSGVGVYHPHLFKDTPDGAFALAPLLRQAMAKDRVGGAHFKQYWCDVGTMERLAQIQDRETSKVR